MEEKVVFFLGAGASAAVRQGVVITRNLLEVALSLTDAPPEVQKAAAEIRALVGVFVPTDQPAPAVDDLLSVVDLALSRRQALDGQWSYARLFHARDALVLLIRHCVEERIHKPPTENNALLDLVHLAVRAEAVFVTLNWDCLLEYAVGQRFGTARPWQDGCRISYGVPCFADAGRHPLAIADDAIAVLKPHGSLNWGFCPCCSRLSVLGEPTRPACCLGCQAHAPLGPVIVPPTALDLPQPVLLEEIWTLAEDAIASCRQLIFVGYSLPSQDIDVRLHLVRALARRRARWPGATLPVTLVRKGSDPQLVERFRFTLGPDVRLVPHDAGLEDWLLRGRHP